MRAFRIYFLIVTGVSQTVYAEQFNRRNLLPGGKAAMMGGAYTALSDDASGSWYNPAGLAFTKGNDVSMSANAFTKTKRTVSGALGGSDVAEASTSIYPAFAGGTTGIGPFRFGYSFFTSDHDSIDESFRYRVPAQGETSAFTYARRLLATGELLHAGASVSFPLGTHLSFGVGEFYYRRSKQTALIESSTFDTGANYDSNIRQSTLNEGMVTTVGLLAKASVWSLGLSAKFPKRLADNTLIESTQVTFTGSTQDRRDDIKKPHSYDEVTPPEYTIGVAWQPASWFLLSSDFIYIPAETSPHADTDGVSTVVTENWSIGSEIALGALVIRNGLFTNNSLVREPTILSEGQPAQINYLGWSGGLSWRGKSSESTIGVIKQVGSGKEQSVSGSADVYKIQSESLTYLLTSRYALSP